MRQHATVMAALEDDTFMAAVARGLAELRSGTRGKTFAEIDAERGF
ncbi:MAG: hypothetical protein ACRDHF_06260 [Tepidiformaceae bacterium]